MRIRLVKILSFALAATAGLLPAVAQDTLPPGPGRAETLKACNVCHGVDVFENLRRTQPQWETTVQNMINFGAPIDDATFDTVVAYLTTYFGPGPRPASPPAAP
jgi:hypothetical protein